MFKQSHGKREKEKKTLSILICIFNLPLFFCSFYSIYNGLIWFLLPASLVVCNDSFAYFCGKALGHKLINAQFLSLSPNKTW